MPDPLKDLASANDEVNAKKKVKDQEYQIKALEKEIASLKSQLQESPQEMSLSSSYPQAVWSATVEALLRQSFSVPGSINANNLKGLESTIEKVLKVADIAVRVAERHEKVREEESKLVSAAKANEALRNLIPPDQP